MTISERIQSDTKAAMKQRDRTRVGALPDAVVKRLFEVASAVAEKLGVTEGGYAVRINNGRDAGQEIFHFHLHVMGGKRLGMP